MPFGETHVVDERRRFVTEVQRSLKSFSAICQRYGISRPTGYKWLGRWEQEGPPGLESRPSRPQSSPWATPEHVVEAILEVRRTHDDYGAKKIIWYLERHRPELPLPSRTTVHNILLRHNLVPKRRKRLRRWHPGRPDTFAAQPNDTWSADFKGEFPTRDGELCYPLTVQDMHSRFVLDCRGRPNVKTVGVFPVFTRLFKEFGLPRRIRTDNGTPFATNTLGRLSRLSVWFIQLGIQPQLIEPGCPQQNGKHENMHLVLKRKATRPPRANLRCQQRAFNDFCADYNHIRPHEALDGAVPARSLRALTPPLPNGPSAHHLPGPFRDPSRLS
jgi:putative transposase